MSDDELIDRFVEAFYLEQIYTHNDPPPDELNAGIDPDDWNVVLWKPARIERVEEQATRIESLRSRLQIRLPPLYEKLVGAWSWLDVSIGKVEMFPSPPGPTLSPLLELVRRDPTFCKHLVAQGIIPFGSSSERFYDPVCFDTSRKYADGDCPVVQYAHERMLSFDRADEYWPLWPSCRSMMRDIVGSSNS